MQRTSPKIYLAIDNCFAKKRWTKPDEWAKVISKLGIKYVEASADTELDPAYMSREYLKQWTKEVKQAEKTHGIKVANLYSGHGSYATLGLAHTDQSVRRHLIDNWFKPMIDIAAELEAGFGFFAHGFSQSVLQSKEEYQKYCDILTTNLSELCEHAAKVGCGKLAVEQMYSPHQVPWRIDETRELMKAIKSRGFDFYFSEDVGHHHVKFVKPSKEDIEIAIDKGSCYNLWLGTDNAYKIFDDALSGKENRENSVERIMQDIDGHEYLFSATEDGDCYRWLEELGCYSPIIHLQQTEGLSSSHKFFTAENNVNGKIKLEKVISSIEKSYQKNMVDDMPVPCENIYLTAEAFFGTAIIPQDGLHDYKATIDHFRKTIPEDGLSIADITKNM